MMRNAVVTVLLAATCLMSAAADDGYGNAHTINRSDIPADPPRPEQFFVKKVYRGVPASPDVLSHPRSRLYRTMIRAGVRQGPNFAGHYTLVMWGCGSGCLGIAIVDVKTGKVFHPTNLRTIDSENVDWDDFAGPDGRVMRFRLNSRLLVVPGGVNEDPKRRGVSYFVWEREELRRIRFVWKPYE